MATKLIDFTVVPTRREQTGRARLIVFHLDERRYALPFGCVGRVVRAVEVTRLPHAPALLLGVINVHGRVIPVINLRRQFHLPERELKLSDQFIIASTARQTVALWVDNVDGALNSATQEVVAAEEIVPGLKSVEGFAKVSDGLILLHSLESLCDFANDHVVASSLLEESAAAEVRDDG